MLPITSTSSPSTAAALAGIAAMQRRAAARQPVDQRAQRRGEADQHAGQRRIDRADEHDREQHTAMHGGSTFQEPVFSSVKAALAVALIRLASAPGRRSAK